MTKTVFPFALMLSVAAAAPAAAGETSSSAAAGRSVTVSYRDLNLASTAGVAEFDRRINGAIRTVCGTADLRVLKEVNQRRACRLSTKALIADQRNQVLAGRQSAGVLAFAKPD